MSGKVETVFLTGGSGVLGQALLEKLNGFHVICLTHAKPIECRGVESVVGDICQPSLGMSRDAFAGLAGRIDYVIHSAANTGFGAAAEETYSTNVDGTRNVLALAEQAGVPFCHMSTAFAHVAEREEGHQANAYEASKLAAEAVVRESGVPYVMLRPSIVVGDSHDGHMSRFQGFHLLCELMIRGVLPVWIPTTPDAYMDFVPQDLVADVTVALLRQPELRGEYWVTSGEHALQIEQALELWKQHIPRLTGRPVKTPRYVEPDVVDRLVRPVFLPSLPERTQQMINQVLDLLGFTVRNPLPSSLPELQTLLGTPPLQAQELTVIHNAEFWARKRGFLDKAERSPEWSDD